MFMEKKVCAFELCLVFIKKYTKSFGGKIFQREKDFLLSKVKYIFRFNTKHCSSQKFFPLGNPPYAKKSKRDNLYFDWLPGPFKSATFFSLFVQQFKTNEKIKTV